MIKVVKKEFNEMDFSYLFTLENEDVIVINERNYDTIMNHVSVNGKEYSAIVDEHENEFEEPIEYLGFIEVN